MDIPFPRRSRDCGFALFQKFFGLLKFLLEADGGHRPRVGFVDEAAALPLFCIFYVSLSRQSEQHVWVFLANAAQAPPLFPYFILQVDDGFHRATRP